MRRVTLLALVVPGLALGVSRAALADDQPPSILITATATSSRPGAGPELALDPQIDDTGWCPAKGDGVGEAITYTFEHPTPLAKLSIVSGTPDKHTLPERVRITADGQRVEATLGAGRYNDVALSGAAVRAVTIAIESLRVGGHGPTCLGGARFVAPGKSGYFYPLLHGVTRAALDALPAFATHLDAALRGCNAAGLADAVQFPLAYTHQVTEGPMNGDSHDATYHSARELVRACRDPKTGIWFGLAGAGVSDTTLADAVAHATSQRDGTLQVGDWGSDGWNLVWSGGRWRVRAIITTEDSPESVTPMITDLIAGQFAAWSSHDQGDVFLPDAQLVVVSDDAPAAIVPMAQATAVLPAVARVKKHVESQIAVTFARDRRSAVLSFQTKVMGPVEYAEYHVSELVVQRSDGWRVATAMWSEPQKNAAVEAAARAGKPATWKPLAAGHELDRGLRAAWLALQKGPLDPVAAARGDLVVFGSGPGERTVGGARFARPWNAAWAGHAPVADGVIGALAPSGTTGWVVADVNQEVVSGGKVAYRVPFRLFLVFDKTVDGTWTLLHAQLATPPPG